MLLISQEIRIYTVALTNSLFQGGDYMERYQDSNLYIAIAGDKTALNKDARKKIAATFDNVFTSSAKKISDVTEDEVTELVYEIQLPLNKEDVIYRDFYSNLEVLLEELSGYCPHFTRFAKGDK